MNENDTPDRTGTGLSTDDIARSSRGGAAPAPDRAEEGRDSGRPPLYPGEAVDTPERGDRTTNADTGTDTSPGDSADTDTGSRADTEAGDRSSDTDSGVGPGPPPGESHRGFGPPRAGTIAT
ncbi:hypothetical protein ACFW1I_08415, partial [Streptomyces sp. NPDC058955]